MRKIIFPDPVTTSRIGNDNTVGAISAESDDHTHTHTLIHTARRSRHKKELIMIMSPLSRLIRGFVISIIDPLIPLGRINAGKIE